ncbi:Uncharacterised protein [Aggregatibacter actinomycetemcomitans]|nr:hypothetical protein [Aggregatibacter actinomycetemcomitans]AHN71522.1 hypothetical protein CF65_01086 [Aggregatibacter actinomycetemcomitans HK1651]EKX96033.1 hypothetical protein HMPREF9996_01377 [Aggregatibacter actinomycetemcomitans Y4]SSY84319.1 Uncharacterised protein [Aggregatibacter actinomycetemcomitans]
MRESEIDNLSLVFGSSPVKIVAAVSKREILTFYCGLSDLA